MASEHQITAGFMPLLDSAVLVVRRRKVSLKPKASISRSFGKHRGRTSAIDWRSAISKWRTCWRRCRSPAISV